MSEILLTGSNGYISRFVLDSIIDKHYVYGCDIGEIDNSQCNRYFVWDLSKSSEPEEMCRLNIDCIIHVAASLDMNNLSEHLIPVNCFGTFNILKLAVCHNVKSIIYFSSLPVVGNEHQIPITESEYFCPPSLYHASKAAGELIIGQARTYGIKVVIIRIPSPIGPGMRPNTILPVFINKALKDERIIIQGKGSRKQNYLDVRDLGEAICRIISCTEMDGIYNIGSKNIISNYDLAKECINVLKSNSVIEYSGKEDPYDSVDWTTSDKKLRDVIGEYQKYDLKKSIRDLADKMK